MSSQAENPQIAAGGGYVEKTFRYRPRVLIFATLSLLWIIPSIGALAILVPLFRGDAEAAGVVELLRQIRFEQWIAIAVLLAQATFVWLTIRLRRSDPERETTGWVPAAGASGTGGRLDDLYKLYAGVRREPITPTPEAPLPGIGVRQEL